jgi:hypothetical protein
MKLSEILTEGRDAPLYHFTRYPDIVEIILSDSLNNVTPQIVNGKDVKGVSLTRDKRFNWTGDIRLMIDQKKLSQRFKLSPVDYFAGPYFKDKKDFHSGYIGLETGYGDKFDRRKGKWAEYEEFVIGKIKPLHNYLVRIDILKNSEALEDEYFMDVLRELETNSGIPHAVVTKF